ncbi:MAG: AMP-binding protein [Verrucomicrobiota bacterium]|nr:AMP-binding protein [Verrucomicrobiota bacterium]
MVVTHRHILAHSLSRGSHPACLPHPHLSCPAFFYLFLRPSVRFPNFSRYNNNPEATAAAFQDGWYKTGDLGCGIREDFYVSGRKKDLLAVAGVTKLSPYFDR